MPSHTLRNQGEAVREAVAEALLLDPLAVELAGWDGAYFKLGSISGGSSPVLEVAIRQANERMRRKEWGVTFGPKARVISNQQALALRRALINRGLIDDIPVVCW